MRIHQRIRNVLWWLKSRVFQRRKYRHGIPIDEIVTKGDSFIRKPKIPWEIKFRNGSTIRGFHATEGEIIGGQFPGPDHSCCAPMDEGGFNGVTQKDDTCP